MNEKIKTFSLKESFKRKKGFIKLCILSKGDFVGFEDIIMNRRRTFSLKCNSLEGGKLYSIRKDVYN